MLRGQSKPVSARTAAWPLLLFSIGGRTLAVRIAEVGAIRPWPGAMSVPSRTVFVNAVVRYGEDVLPVFDLAGLLKAPVQGASPMCLIAKRQDGPMAICIDAAIPKLMTVQADELYPPSQADPNVLWECRIEGQAVPIYAMAELGLAPVQAGKPGSPR